MRSPLVLYDEDCGICARLASRLAAGGVEVAPIGSSTGDRWLRDLTRDARYDSFHAIDGAGRRRSGGAAVPIVLDALARRRSARVARALPGVTEAVYRLVARHRRALSRLVGAVSCAPGSTRASRGRAG
jgi:predicted DCC family thiol-disulfide oxidoreductase YuxK